MAFVNSEGKSISYECSGLIEALNEEMILFGGDEIVEVIYHESHGVKLYTDYKFKRYHKEWGVEFRTNDKVTEMTATALMELLKVQNEII